MIVAGQLLLNDDANAGCAILRPGFIRIRQGRIEETVIGQIPDTADVGSPDVVIRPGWVDTHLHLPQFDMIGAHGLPLLQWLERFTFPAELKWNDATHAQAMTDRVIDQCFAHGTTAICAYATVHHEAALAALRQATLRGMRGVIGQVLMDRSAPEELLSRVDTLIQQADTLLNHYPPDRRMAAAVTPRFAISCTEELLCEAGKLADRHQAIIQTHLSETRAECELVQQLFDGQNYVDVYRSAGLLTPRSILGHGIHLSESDCSKLADSGSMIAHCPTANSFLRSGTMNRSRLLDRGVAVALGSDIGAGYERSMVRTARAMIEAAALLGQGWPSAAEAWWQIAFGNAKAMGWQDWKRLQEGAPADLVIIRPPTNWRRLDVDLLDYLMFAWDDRWIDSTYCSGKRVYPFG